MDVVLKRNGKDLWMSINEHTLQWELQPDSSSATRFPANEPRPGWTDYSDYLCRIHNLSKVFVPCR